MVLLSLLALLLAVTVFSVAQLKPGIRIRVQAALSLRCHSGFTYGRMKAQAH